MKLYNEKLRSSSQRSKRQAQHSLFLLAKSQKIAFDDAKHNPFRKNDAVTLVEFPTDYNTTEIKGFRISQTPSLISNGNGLRNDLSHVSNHHQAYVSTKVFKLDKEMLLNNNSNGFGNINNGIIIQPNRELYQYPEGYLNYHHYNNKPLTNFLQIKSLSTQNSAINRLNQQMKNVLPGLNPSDRDKKNPRKEDNFDAPKKRKLMIKSFSGMRSRTPFQDTIRLGNLPNFTEIDEQFQINGQTKEILNQSPNKHRETRSRTISERRKDSRELLNFNVSNSNNGISISNNPQGIPSAGPSSPTSNEKKSIFVLKSNTNSPPPQRFIPLHQIKEISSLNRRLANVAQFQKMINPYAYRGNPQFMSNPVSLSQSAIIISSNNVNTPNQNLEMNSMMMNLIQSNTISTKITRIEHQKPMPSTYDEKKKVYIAPPPNTNFKYFIGPGNNAELVKRVMSKREWWEECEEYNSLFNFKWQQYDRGYKYERLIPNQYIKQVVNHFEFQREISTKNLLIKNLAAYSEQNKLSLFDMTPTTFIFDMDDEANFDSDMQNFAKFFIKHHSNPSKYPKPEGSKHSHIVFNFDFKRKKSSIITTNNDKKVSSYLKPKMHNTFNKGFNIWLLKPTGYNRGRGIEVFNTLEALNIHLNEYFDGFIEVGPNQKKPKKNEGESDSEGNEDEDNKRLQGATGAVIKSHTFVLQKYIESPLLINQRKFDIRIWAMITHEMNLYFFKEGYLRLSSEIFTLNENNIDNKFIHLTNNAVQKYSENYGQYENGNQLSFAGFEEYIANNSMSGDFRGKILPRMKELVSISMNSVKKVLNSNDRKYCIEIFGYDFFIDSEFNVWLIEVNTNPCIEESSPILEQYLPRMLDDGFKMTLDVLFPRPIKKAQPNQSIQIIIQEGIQQSTSQKISSNEGNLIHKEKEKVYSVDGYKDDENMWEFLCNLNVPKSPVKNAKKPAQSLRPKKNWTPSRFYMKIALNYHINKNCIYIQIVLIVY